MKSDEIRYRIAEVQGLITKKYPVIEHNFVYDWADRWFQLGILLLDLFRFDETPSPPPPTEIEEINYQNLRF